LSTLTKICVVLLLVLVLLACPVFINLATVPYNYKSQHDNQKALNTVLQLSLNTTGAARDAAVEEAKQASDRARQTEAEKNAKVSQLESDRDKLKIANAQLESGWREVNAKLAALSSNYEQYLKDRQLLAEQLDRTQKKYDQAAEEARRGDEANKQLEGQVERYEHQVKFLREQLQGKDEEIANLRQQIKEGVAAAPKGGPPDISAQVPPVTGTILNLKNDVAEINIGSAKGIAPGMKLIIFRENPFVPFVAYLRVDEVDLNRAVGVIVDRKGEPVRGDKVTTPQALKG